MNERQRRAYERPATDANMVGVGIAPDRIDVTSSRVVIALSGPFADGTKRCDFCGDIEPPDEPVARSPITVFICGGPRRPRKPPAVPRGREVQLTIDTMPKPKRPPGDRR